MPAGVADLSFRRCAALATSTLTITLPDELAIRLTAAASTQGVAVDALVTRCIEQHLETALRHSVLIERLEIVDAQIDAIARFVEKAASGGGLDPVDLFRICRYPKKA